MFDNGGTSFDRYTLVVTDSDPEARGGYVCGMSLHPKSTSGFNQFCGHLLDYSFEDYANLEEMEERFGERVSLDRLEKEVLVAVIERLDPEC